VPATITAVKESATMGEIVAGPASGVRNLRRDTGVLVLPGGAGTTPGPPLELDEGNIAAYLEGRALVRPGNDVVVRRRAGGYVNNVFRPSAADGPSS
jgi:hypothetical protein